MIANLEALLGEDARKFLILFMTVLVFGGIGGFVGGTYRKRHGIEPSVNSWKDGTVFFLCGVISAFGVVALCSGVASFFDKAAVLHKGISLVGVSLLSGFFSMRILPHLGAQLEKRIGDVEKKTSEKDAELEKRTSDIVGKLNDAEKLRRELSIFVSVSSVALAALQSGSSTDAEYAINRIQKHFELFKKERLWVIIYGRLLHRVKRNDDAITVLEEYIADLTEERKSEGKEFSNEDKHNLATAYFNIACYYNNRSDGNAGLYLDQVRSSLEKSFALMPSFKRDWHDDDDLKSLEKDFIK